jgi:threonine synthase
MACAVLVPDGKIAMGKLSQAVAHGATLLQVEGNFDDCLTVARKLAEAYPVELVNSVNPARIEGQKTAAFEIVDALGDAPDIHCLPVGNAGNITAYWQGYREYAAWHAGRSASRGWPGHPPAADVGLPGRRSGADRPRAPGRRARDHRHRDPDRQPGVVGQAEPPATTPAGASTRSPTSRSSTRTGSSPRTEGVFVEPGSAARSPAAQERAGGRRRPARGHHRLHGDRPRPQGPAVGAAPRPTAARSPRPASPSTPTPPPRRSAWKADPS